MNVAGLIRLRWLVGTLLIRFADDRISAIWGLEDAWNRTRQLAGDDVTLGELGSLIQSRVRERSGCPAQHQIGHPERDPASAVPWRSVPSTVRCR